ncbi:rRNA maturation RNase YbeY [Chloroflexota bacterium]
MGGKSSDDELVSEIQVGVEARVEDRLEAGIEVQIAPAFTEILSAEPLHRVAQEVLDLERALGQATLVITDDEAIQALNRDFLGHDTPTDVLAFSARESGGDFVAAPEAGSYLGDVIVSYPRAAAQARELGHAVEQELYLLIIHGMLHLLGYNHETEGDKAAMWARQEVILAECMNDPKL